VLGKLFRSISKALGSDPALKERLAQGEDWLTRLSEPLAKEQALALLYDADRFTIVPGPGAGALPPWVSPSTMQFFNTFRSASAKFADFAVDIEYIRPSPTESPLLQLGWYAEHVEICISPVDGLVYRVANDVPGDERREGSDPTLWHVVLRLAIDLGYVDTASDPLPPPGRAAT
jgi:hypothetical protein